MSALESGRNGIERQPEQAADQNDLSEKHGGVSERPVMLMPGEVPESPDGGEYIVDPNADPATPGVFTYEGFKLRPATPQEYAEITALSADPKRHKEKGPQRLADLLKPRPSAETTSRQRDPGRFKPIYRHDGSENKGINGYRFLLEDGTYEKDPDGSDKRFTQDEVNQARDRVAEARSQNPPENPHVGTPLSAEDQARQRAAMEGRIRAVEQQNNAADVRAAREQLSRATDQHDFDQVDNLLRRKERSIVGGNNRAGREAEPTAQELTRRLEERNQQQGRDRRTDVIPEPETSGPQLPTWAGRYGASWNKFDPTLYADVKHKLSIPEIRNNPLYQQLFGELILSVDPSRADFAKRLLGNEPLLPADARFVNFIQNELSKNVERCDWLKENLTTKEVELLLPKDESGVLRALVEANGSERTTEAFKLAIYHKANHNKAEFDKFFRSVKHLTDKQKTGRAQKAETATQAICDRYGVQRAMYGDFVDLSSKASRTRSEQRLANHIHEHAGTFRTVLDKIESKWGIAIAGSSRSAALHAVTQENLRNPDQYRFFDPRSWVTGGRYNSFFTGENQGIAADREDMLEYLKYSVSGPEFRHAMEREAFLGEKVVPAIESGPANFGEMKGMLAKDSNSPQAMRRRIRTIIDSDPNWGNKTQEQQDAVLRSHKATESLGQTKGMGLLAWILRAIFGVEYNKAAREELGRPVHA